MVKDIDNDTVTLPRSVLQKFIDEAYEKGRRDALREKRPKTHKKADIGGMSYKANIVFDDEEEEDERKS